MNRKAKAKNRGEPYALPPAFGSRNRRGRNPGAATAAIMAAMLSMGGTMNIYRDRITVTDPEDNGPKEKTPADLERIEAAKRKRERKAAKRLKNPENVELSCEAKPDNKPTEGRK